MCVCVCEREREREREREQRVTHWIFKERMQHMEIKMGVAALKIYETKGTVFTCSEEICFTFHVSSILIW